MTRDSELCRKTRSWPPRRPQHRHDMNNATEHTPSASQGQRQPANYLLAMALDVAARECQRQPTRPTAKRKARGQQVRLRLAQATAEQLRPLPARVRGEVVTMLVNAALAGVPVERLVGYRQELKNLGLLVNQSLRVSRGQSCDVVAVERAAAVISKLIQR